MANEVYFPAIPETDKVDFSNYLIIDNKRTGKGDKIQIDNFIDKLGLVTTNTLPTPIETFVEVTYAQASTLINNSTLVEGTHYKITDRADNGIVLLAVSSNQFSLEGQGFFYNVDYQAVGNYSGLSNYNSTYGIWDITFESTGIQWDVVFWNGNHYIVSIVNFNGTDPSVNNLAYSILTRSTPNVGYIEEIDFIYYDFTADYINYRVDKRGNKIEGFNNSTIQNFQWGNDSVYNNTISTNANIDCSNNKGSINNNTFSNGINITSNCTLTGIISLNRIKGDSSIIMNSNATISNCDIDASYPITLDSNTNFIDNTLNDKESTFSWSLNMNTQFSTGNLTIPSILNYIGIFTLINNTGQTISKILNLPTTHTSRFYVQNGNTQIFSHTTVASAILNELVSDAATTNTVTGRTNGSDFIDYKRSGNLNRRENASILA